MSVFIYSTQAAHGDFCIYAPKVAGQEGAAVHRVALKKIRIKGGAGVAHAQKMNSSNFDPDNIIPSLYTPRGVVTEVSDEDFSLLSEHPIFKKALEKKIFSYEKRKVDIEKKIEKGDIIEKDEKGPLTPDSIKADARGNPNDKRLRNKEYPGTTATTL